MGLLVVLSTILVFNFIAWKMQKQTSSLEMYTTILYALFFSCLTDMYASFRHLAWGFFEEGIPDYERLLIVFGIYPAATVIITNWYPFDKSWHVKFFYLLAWSVFSTGYEWLTLKIGVLWHENWHLAYSFFLYPFIYHSLILNIRFCRRYLTNIKPEYKGGDEESV